MKIGMEQSMNPLESTMISQEDIGHEITVHVLAGCTVQTYTGILVDLEEDYITLQHRQATTGWDVQTTQIFAVRREMGELTDAYIEELRKTYNIPNRQDAKQIG